MEPGQPMRLNRATKGRKSSVVLDYLLGGAQLAAAPSHRVRHVGVGAATSLGQRSLGCKTHLLEIPPCDSSRLTIFARDHGCTCSEPAPISNREEVHSAIDEQDPSCLRVFLPAAMSAPV